jgi:transcription termination/antitermination protein NusG
LDISLKGTDFVDEDNIEELEQASEDSETSPQPDTESNSNLHLDSHVQAHTEIPISDSKFFAIRTTGGQEHVVVNMAQNKINSKKIPVRSILLLDSFKGYIIVEAPDSNIAYEALAGIRHVKGQIRGELPYKDIEGYLVKRPVVTELNIDDTVEVIAGPFKSMKAKITRVDYEKQEATVLLLDSPYQIPVTVDANYLKKIAQ